MVFEQWARKIAASQTIKMIALTGGEPFLHPSLPSLAHIARSFAGRVSITTNATVCDESLIKELARIKNLHFLVSLDGPSRLHEKIRGGKGAFSKLEKFTSFLKEYHIPFLINMTVSETNCSYVEETVELAEQLGARDISIALVKPEGRGSKLPTSTNQMLLQVSHSVLRAKAKLASDNFCITFFDPLAHIFIPDQCQYNCGALQAALHVQTSGLVRICTSCSENIGNINEEGFNVLDRLSTKTQIRQVDARLFKGEGCRTCEFKDVCGGCRCRAKNLAEDFLSSDPLCPKTTLAVHSKDSNLQGYAAPSVFEAMIDLVRKRNSSTVVTVTHLGNLDKLPMPYNTNQTISHDATLVTAYCNDTFLRELPHATSLIQKEYPDAQHLLLMIERTQNSIRGNAALLDSLKKVDRGYPELLDFSKYGFAFLIRL